MLWITTSDIYRNSPCKIDITSNLFGFLFKNSSFNQQNSHSAELTEPLYLQGFFYWKNTLVPCADFSIRLLVWLMLITHPPSHDWFCSCCVGNPKGGILLTNDQFSISLLLMIQFLWISAFFALPLRIKALRRENACWRKDSKKPRCWPGLFTVLGRDNYL